MRVLVIVAAVLSVTPVVARSQTAEPAPTRAILAAASSDTTARVIVDGATWKCEGNRCVASGGNTQPATRACRRVAARLGPVTEFAWKGTVLSADELAACNAR